MWEVLNQLYHLIGVLLRRKMAKQSLFNSRDSFFSLLKLDGGGIAKPLHHKNSAIAWFYRCLKVSPRTKSALALTGGGLEHLSLALTSQNSTADPTCRPISWISGEHCRKLPLDCRGPIKRLLYFQRMANPSRELNFGPDYYRLSGDVLGTCHSWFWRLYREFVLRTPT